MNQEFLRPRLEGVRFDEHSIPLELLKDFVALEEMLIEVAKWKYRQAHPESKRIQRNFSKGLELHLANIEDGSAIASIVLMFTGLLPAENNKYLEQAKIDIVEAIASAEQGRCQQLPLHLLSYFDRFGRGLHEGEAMEFARQDGSLTRLTHIVRKQLIRSAQVSEWTEEVALRGKVSQIDSSKKIFQLELRDGTKLKAPLNPQHLDTLVEAVRDYDEGAYVLLQGGIKKDQQDHPKEVVIVEHVSQLEALDVSLRLDALSTLRDGWLDGKGIAPTGEKLDWLAKQFDAYFSDDLPLPHLYPTPEGGIQAEWSIGEWDVTLEIDLSNFFAQYQAMHFTSREVQEYVLQLEEASGWRILNHQLKRIGESLA